MAALYGRTARGTAERDGFIADKMLGIVDSALVPPAARLGFWKAHVDTANGLDIQCRTPNFLGKMTTRTLGTCSVHGVQIMTPHRAVRTRSQQDLCFANVQVNNEGARFCGAREFSMPRGSLILYEASESYELDFDGASESLVLAIPKSDLQKRVANLQMHLDEPISYDSHKISMLASLMKGVIDSGSEARQSVQDSMAEAVINMLLATLLDAEGTAVSRAPTYGNAALLQRVKGYINTNLADPNLNTAMVAEAMGITVSYLHKIFMANNTTVMQYVLAERLERCRKDIAKADRTGGISQVAYAWGFNDASHFSRSFRKRFEMSPREYKTKVMERDARL
ncbi:MAG: helix-turn-helix domain-containing protein [Rhodobacteraceae bacterium]|nr:helix-turn-helix domain-containing protein [Paracoccaceae bacterium]